MPQQTLNNEETFASIRSKLNAMLTELYALAGAGEGGGIARETQPRSAGTPNPCDPETTSVITHTLTGSYSEIPPIVVQSKCDWDIYYKDATLEGDTVTVIVGIGAEGTATSIDYDVVVF